MNTDTQLLVSRQIRNVATRSPGKVVIEYDEIRVTAGQLVERMNRLAHMAISGWGLQSGDVVALVIPNRPEYIEIVAGLSDQGIVVATLNPRMTAKELTDILEDCKPRVVILDPALEALIEPAKSSGGRVLFLGSEYEGLLQRASDRFMAATASDHQTFAISYTSGTTGVPKGVLLSHRSRSLVALASAVEYQCFGRHDRFLAMSPLYHGAGFAFALSALSFGGTCIIFNRNDPEQMLGRLGEGDISSVFMVPTHFKRLFDLSEPQFNSLSHGHRLRTIISNAAALSPKFKEQTVRRLGDGLLYEAYGSTEAGIVTTIAPEFLLLKPNSVGTPFCNSEVEIRREDGTLCEPGEVGELYSRNPYTFNGYLNRPDETAEVLKDGWITVYDLASRDEDGFISIVGRKKDMVISGGVNIYPAEIEATILKLPNVLEVAVVGLPDEEWGECLHAFVVGNGQPLPSESEIITACRTKLSGIKTPKGVTFVDELPRNASGKILKRELREMNQR